MSHRKFFATKAQLKRDYYACLSLLQLAKDYGVSKKLILRYMNAFGIKRIPRSSPVEQVKKLASSGVSAKQIAKTMGYTAKGVRDIGRKNGILFVRKYEKDGECRKKRTVAGRGKILVHRLEMEEKLGRVLMPTEVVHHEKDDSRKVFPSQSDHARNHSHEHMMGERARRKSRFRGLLSQKAGDTESAR